MSAKMHYAEIDPNFPITHVAYGVSGIKPEEPTVPIRKPIYVEHVAESEDAMDANRAFSPKELFDPRLTRGIEEILEDLEERHLAGEITLDELVTELNDATAH